MTSSAVNMCKITCAIWQKLTKTPKRAEQGRICNYEIKESTCSGTGIFDGVFYDSMPVLKNHYRMLS